MNPRFENRIDLIYDLEDKPPIIKSILYAVQWLIVFLPMLTVVSVLISEVMGLSPSLQESFFQRLLIITGFTMVLQTLWGHRLPILDGPAMALVITVATLADQGFEVVNGGMIFGASLVLLIGALGLMKYITPLFTDRVVGVILLLIGLTVLPVLAPMLLGVDRTHPAGSPLVLFLGISLILFMGIINNYFKGLIQSLSVFLGIAAGMVLFSCLGLVDYSGISKASWFSMPRNLIGPAPKFEIGAALSFALAYLAVLVNAIGSIFSLDPLLAPADMRKRVNRSVLLTGISGMAAGGASSVGTVPFSLSPGIIAITRVGSRSVVFLCGLFVFALAFFGKVTALLSTVPDAVVAAALIIGLAAQTGVSVEILTRGKNVLDGADYLVIGLPVILGTMASLIPQQFLNLLPSSLRPLVGNGLIVGVVLVILMEHVVFRRKQR